MERSVAALVAFSLVLVGAAVIGMNLVPMMGGGSGGGPLAGDAVRVCERIMLERLKAPATATFQPRNQVSVGVTDQQYTVRGYVDAQNSFSALIRNDYQCVFQWDQTQPERPWIVLVADGPNLR